MSENVTPDRILQTGLGFFAAKTLLSAVDLDLFTVLDGESLGAEELERRVDLHPRSSADFLDALVALGFLEREDGMYSNTPETKQFLVRGKPGYVGDLLQMANDRLYPFWDSLSEGLQTGNPQNELKQEGVEDHFFDTIYADDDRLEQFVSAMTGLSSGIARELSKQFPWEQYDSLCDVGTSEGVVPATIAGEHEHLQAIGFDLPKVEQYFDDFLSDVDHPDRVSFRSGNFFEDELPEADVLVMGHILHDWGYEEKMELLEKAHRALPKDGALIVYGAIIDPERRENAFGLMMSLNMLIETPNGFDYTVDDCIGWMEETGFSETRSEQLSGPASMVVGFK